MNGMKKKIWKVRKMRTDTCTQCGRCCTYVAAPIPPLEDREYWQLHGAKIFLEEQLMLLPLECIMHIKHANGVSECYIYNNRPEFCKNFPKDAPPSLLKALKCELKSD